MQPSDQDPYRKYPPLAEEPHSGWNDALLIGAFLLFIYIFITTGGFIPKAPQATATPLFGVSRVLSSATIPVVRSVTPSPTRLMLTATPTPSLPVFFYRQPDIRGAVVEIYTLNGKVTGAYVRGKLEADTSLAQAFVKFSDNTELFIRSADQYQMAGLDQLASGDTVEVFFINPAAQTAGEQPVAEEIVILK